MSSLLASFNCLVVHIALIVLAVLGFEVVDLLGCEDLFADLDRVSIDQQVVGLTVAGAGVGALTGLTDQKRSRAGARWRIYSFV